MAGNNGQRVNKAVCTTIVIGLETLELSRLLAVRTCHRLTRCVTWQSAQLAVHRVGLQPVLRRQELDVQSCFASQLLWHGLIQPYGNLNGLAFGCHYHAAVKVVVVIAQPHLDGACCLVHLTAGHRGHKVPLLWRVVQAHSTALYGTHPVVDNLYTRVLLVVESAIEAVAEYQHIHTLTLKILKVVHA